MCGIITNSSILNLNKKEIKLYPNETIDEYIDSSDIILYCGYNKEKTIALYDISGKYVFDKKYPYVKDFIDILISQKINNKDKFDINDELDKFIFQNSPKKKNLHINNKKCD